MVDNRPRLRKLRAFYHVDWNAMPLVKTGKAVMVSPCRYLPSRTRRIDMKYFGMFAKFDEKILILKCQSGQEGASIDI